MQLMVRAALAHWKRLGRRIGDAQARLLLLIFYFVIIGPFALLLRWRADPLGIKPGTRRGWLNKETSKGAPMERALQQF
jgi:hypothetical protein